MVGEEIGSENELFRVMGKGVPNGQLCSKQSTLRRIIGKQKGNFLSFSVYMITLNLKISRKSMKNLLEILRKYRRWFAIVLLCKYKDLS